MGPIAKPCKWARPRRCHGVGQQRLSGLESAVELRLREKSARKLQNLIGSAQFPVLSLQGLELLAFAAGHTLALSRVHFGLFDPLHPRSAAHSRPWVQWIQWQPTGMGTRPGVPAPCEQRVRAFLVKNDSISCSWLHLLKVWSLLKTRGDSLLAIWCVSIWLVK